MFLYLTNNVKQCSNSKQCEKRVFELGIKLLLYDFYILDTLSLPPRGISCDFEDM